MADETFNSWRKYSEMLGHAGHKSEVRVLSTQEAYSLIAKYPLGFGIKEYNAWVTGFLLNIGMFLGVQGITIVSLLFAWSCQFTQRQSGDI